MPRQRTHERAERWTRSTEIPLLVLSFVYLAAFAVPIAWPDLSDSVRAGAETTLWVTWVLFAVEFAGRWWISVDRLRFLGRNVLDLALLILPLARPLRVLRLVFVMRVLHRRAQIGFRGQVIGYTVASVGLIGFVASLAVLDAERRNPEANIETMGDSAWWALTTITTVGYGDHSPTTGEGRFAAALLMLAGIALLGVVTGTMASWFVERLRGVEQAEERSRDALQEILSEVRTLGTRIERLERELLTARPEADPAPPAGSVR